MNANSKQSDPETNIRSKSNGTKRQRRVGRLNPRTTQPADYNRRRESGISKDRKSRTRRFSTKKMESRKCLVPRTISSRSKAENVMRLDDNCWNANNERHILSTVVILQR